MFFDTAYVVKFYREESGSESVRRLVVDAPFVLASSWARPEFHAVLHRHVREGSLAAKDARLLAGRFDAHTEMGIWKLAPLTDSLLRRTCKALLEAPESLYLRAGDAVHLQTAKDAGEREVWTNDRHMLAAAKYFGLRGRSV